MCISLVEYESSEFALDQISSADGESLWRQYGKKVTVEFPSPVTSHHWQLCSQGWVGHLPVNEQFSVRIHPRVALKNLFGMLDYAYRIRDIAFLQGLADCESLRDFFDRLVRILASQVSNRIRQGLHRDYVSTSDRVTAIRGRIDLARQLQRPGLVGVDCCFDELTADLKENQIIAWTLWRATRTGLCSNLVLQSASKVLRVMLSEVSLTPATSADCVCQKYNRLNEDYRPIHALCRFLIENVGPSQEFGQHQMLPFIVNMGRVFELFVAEWMNANLPENYSCEHQQRVKIGNAGDIVFRLDIVVCDKGNTRPVFVIDTKYKVPDAPSNADIAQVVTYATLKNCREAILVYPQKLKRPVDILIGAIRVRSLTFPISGDLDHGGRSFLAELLHVGLTASG